MVGEGPGVEVDGSNSGCREFKLSRGFGAGSCPSDCGGSTPGIDECTADGKAGDCGG